jgi:hypothetical protein
MQESNTEMRVNSSGVSLPTRRRGPCVARLARNAFAVMTVAAASCCPAADIGGAVIASEHSEAAALMPMSDVPDRNGGEPDARPFNSGSVRHWEPLRLCGNMSARSPDACKYADGASDAFQQREDASAADVEQTSAAQASPLQSVLPPTASRRRIFGVDER